MDGGGEASKITDAPNGIEQFAWSPDGKQIAYVTADDAPNKKEIEKHNDAFEVGDDDFLTTGAPTPSHIWLISAQGGDRQAAHFRLLEPAEERAAQFACFADFLVAGRQMDHLRQTSDSPLRRFRPGDRSTLERGIRRNQKADQAREIRRLQRFFTGRLANRLLVSPRQ